MKSLRWLWSFQPRASMKLSLSARAWIGLSMVAPLGMLMVSSAMLLELRGDAWQRLEQTSNNLLQVVERDIARNVELYNLSIQGVVDGLQQPEIMRADPALRQLVLFGRAAAAKDMGALVVLDENGDIIIDAQALPPRKMNYADRDYFQAHKADSSLGLHISRPLTSRLLGTQMIVLSKRINKPDGSFGGIVLGTWNLSYFRSLFERLSLGPQSAIILLHLDGTRIMRHPYASEEVGLSVAGTVNFERFRREGAGSFVAFAVRDGVERHFAFTRIGDLPLILAVGTATEEVASQWRAKAVGITLIVLALGGLTISLALLLGGALHRRTVAEEAAKQANAALAELAVTDSLTGLANRRQFDDLFAQEWQRSRRSGGPLSLLIIDVDHFKRINDRYGHQVGDEVLQGLAQRLNACIRRPSDRAYRLGGEEFALLLADTNQDGAWRIADRVHAAVASLENARTGIPAGGITVSIGMACADPTVSPKLTRMHFFRMADAALYNAKAGGRNQTKAAQAPSRKPTLTIMAAAS